MSFDWTIGAAAREMTGELVSGNPSGQWAGAVIDSRKVAGGELFFALRGEQTDGHRFVDQAILGGVSGVVVEIDQRNPASAIGDRAAEAAWIRVDDSLAGLHALTRAVRRQISGSVIGVTGSVGKTTTKDLLATLLSSRLSVVKSPGNLNNLYGFPLALLGVEQQFDWMVAEMGMSTPGELRGVAELGRPSIAVMLNVRPAHLANFESMRAVAEAKAELLEGLEEGGTIIANADDPEISRVVERYSNRHSCTVVTFGYSPTADVTAVDVEPRVGQTGYRLTVRWKARDEEIGVELPLHGEYNVANFLAAAACAREIGLDPTAIAEAVLAAESPAMRGQIHRTADGVMIVDDTYNSNPAAARGALESARSLPGHRHIAVLGDMLELGPREREFHRELGRRAAELGFSQVVGVGSLAADIVAAASDAGLETCWFESADRAAEWAANADFRPDDVMLVKGSRGVGLEVVVAALTDEEAA